MKVLVDADGCPVTRQTVALCKKHNVPCMLLCDTAHTFFDEYAETIVVDKGADSVDYALIRRAAPGDIVITQDYGLASMCLAKNTCVLHQNGWEYTPDNIDALLLERHEARNIRASGKHIRGPAKRTAAQNKAFLIALEALLQKAIHG